MLARIIDRFNFLTFDFWSVLQATWVYREVSAPYLFLVALFHPAIRWRAGEFRLKWGGVVEISEKTQKPKKICV
jgi:hypothetical protein